MEEAPKPAEAPKVDEPAAAPAAAATPKALDDLFNAKPALKAAFDADPEAKAVLMETARQAEAARPILDMLPTVEEARSVVETANLYSGIQHSLAMSEENPEAGERGFQQFLDLFKLRDDKGQVMMKDGQPVLAQSFDYLSQRIATGALSGTLGASKQELDALNQKLATGVYPSDALKEADRVAAVDLGYKIAAIEYVAEMLKDDGGPGELPALPDDATPAQKEFQQRLQKDLEERNKAKGEGAKAKRVADRRALEVRVNQAYGGGIGEYIDNELTARKARGEVIPDFILERKWINPATNQETKVRDFGMRVMNRFNVKVNSIPSVARKLQELELAGAPAEAQRIEYFSKLRSLYLPGIFDQEFNAIHDSIRSMSRQSQERQAAVAQVARVEPQTGGQAPVASGRPALTGDALEAQAMENLQTNPEFQAAGRSDRFEMLMVEKERLRSGR